MKLEPGDVVLFPIGELLSAYFVLGTSGRDLAIALVDWSGNAPVPIEALATRSFVMVFCCTPDGQRPLEGQIVLGRQRPSREQLASLLKPMPIRTLQELKEEAAKRFAPALAQKIENDRQKSFEIAEAQTAEGLRKLWPLDRLDDASLFEDWEYLDPHERAALRNAIRSAIKRGRSLGSTASDGAKRAVIQELVERLNAIEEEYSCIETVEREDLCEIIEAIAVHWGLEWGLSDHWRDW